MTRSPLSVTSYSAWECRIQSALKGAQWPSSGVVLCGSDAESGRHVAPTLLRGTPDCRVVYSVHWDGPPQFGLFPVVGGSPCSDRRCVAGWLSTASPVASGPLLVARSDLAPKALGHLPHRVGGFRLAPTGDDLRPETGDWRPIHVRLLRPLGVPEVLQHQSSEASRSELPAKRASTAPRARWSTLSATRSTGSP